MPTKQPDPQRGEVYLVQFDPTRGAEIRKTRPALIIQNDISNRKSRITIVAAVTSQFDERLYPTEVLIAAGDAGLQRDSVVLLNQVRSIDRQRLLKRLGRLANTTMQQVDRAIAISLGLIDPR